MSLPPELRVLCHQLSSTTHEDLPRKLPMLIRYVGLCRVSLSTPHEDVVEADTANPYVLIHKFKTQLTTLLNGKHSQERFAAAALIKAVVDAAGWEVLRGSGAWVRSLLGILIKPEPLAVKQACTITLTKIYCLTQPYQTLLREITTPTLPTFINSCLSMMSSKSSVVKPSSLLEVAFGCLSLLLPLHITVFRPFASQLRLVVKPYLAPTESDTSPVSSLVQRHARRLYVQLHQTASKNTGSEAWSKAMRVLVKEVHITADQVFRALIEDWESTEGYIADKIDVNQPVSGGGRGPDDLSPWNGIAAGADRLVGWLQLLQEYLMNQTSFTVFIPLSLIFDVVTRILSIPMLSSSPASKSDRGHARLHPAIDRHERDMLCCRLPQFYIAALQVVSILLDRLGYNFISMARGSLDLAVWVFASGKHDPCFRSVIYALVAKLLRLVGPSLDKAQTTSLLPIIRSTCKDIMSADLVTQSPYTGASALETGLMHHSASINATGPTSMVATNSCLPENLLMAAGSVICSSMSYLPQQHVDLSIRSLLERTSILSNNKDAMLASILYPYIGKNSKDTPSILPHYTRAFPHDNVTEILLKPRMPLVPTASQHPLTYDQEDVNEEAMDEDQYTKLSEETERDHVISFTNSVKSSSVGLGVNKKVDETVSPFGHTSADALPLAPDVKSTIASESLAVPTSESHKMDQPTSRLGVTQHGEMSVSYESDDESVHLVMELDTASESEQ